ncbi:MAG: ribonuclease Z [Candidatus Odinarchaeia archaeon]
MFFLGTSGGMPTVNRSGPSVAVRKNGRIILFDCGEGTQVQMQKISLSIVKISKILISHLHGDHIAGLPGLLMSMGLFGRKKPLLIIGPKGVRRFMSCLKDTAKLGIVYEIKIIELDKEHHELNFKDHKIIAVKALHNEVFAYSYILEEKQRPGRFYPEKALNLGIPEGELWSRLQKGEKITIESGVILPSQVMGPPRRGRKIVYTGDTRPNNILAEYASEADLLIHESTFDSSLSERALEYGHSTAVEAADFAVKTKVKKLVLFHISPRYSDVKILLTEAKKIFENTIIAQDLQKIFVPFPE